MTQGTRVEDAQELRSAVAHELNNVLTVVRTYTHFARQPTTPDQAAQDLRVVAAAAERASALVDWLSAESEQTAAGADDVSANELVSVLCARLEQLVEPGTSVEIMRASTDVSLRANALRLEHVVMSLVLAASQRWPQTVFKFSVERTAGVAAGQLDLAVGPYVVLVISCQDATKESDWQSRLLVPADHVAALAEPLADLLRTMNGKLEFLRTNAGEDRFELYLPEAPTPSLAPTKPRLALAPPSRHTVCIIEDEVPIRQAMKRALSNAGHFVIEANDGTSARALLVEHGRAVRLLLCDLGRVRDHEDFFSWVRATCPNAALLLVSGNEREGEAKASSLRARFLAKPFTPSELVSAALQTIGQADAERRGAASTERPVVLVVDDEQVIRDSLQRLLAECEFDTLVANSAPHALRVLEERRVDAIVTDQFMPGLGGIDLLELVYERFPECRRILCTGHPSSDLVISAINRGRVQRVLPKSMHAVALRDEIERAVLEGMHAKK